MLKLLASTAAVIDTDDFYIVEKADGLDELIFNISIYDPLYPEVQEEAVVEYEQPYLVKAIDAGSDMAKVKCQIDLDELREDMKLAYTNGSDTLYGTISSVLPTGWVFLDESGSTIQRTIEGSYTPLEIIQECMSTYDVAMRFNVAGKRITAYSLDSFEPMGAFASRDLNLTEINYKGKSTDFYTRLYAYGKDGLSFAAINDGKPYVDNNQYTSKVVSAYWQDDRYEVAESLLEDAKAMLKEASIPVRSYECTVYDLAETNPDMYGFQDFSLFSVIKLIDDIKGISVNYQVVEYWRYPYYPEKNVVTLSSAAPKIQNSVKNLQNQIENPRSDFRSFLDNAINNATEWLTGVDGGYVIFNRNSQGQPFEMLIMDTDDISTAQNVWRFNQNGWGHSSNGYGGPYTMAATIDGGFVADFITTGTMLADRIHGGTLQLGGANNADGMAVVKNASGDTVVEIDQNGLSANGSLQSIGGGAFVYIQNGRISIGTVTNGTFNTLGVIYYIAASNSVQIQSYGRNGAGNAVLALDGDGKADLHGDDALISGNTVDIVSNGDMSLSCYGTMNVVGGSGRSGTAKSGQVVFSDGSYLNFVNGILTGGNTTEGGAF